MSGASIIVAATCTFFCCFGRRPFLSSLTHDTREKEIYFLPLRCSSAFLFVDSKLWRSVHLCTRNFCSRGVVPAGRASSCSFQLSLSCSLATSRRCRIYKSILRGGRFTEQTHFSQARHRPKANHNIFFEAKPSLKHLHQNRQGNAVFFAVADNADDETATFRDEFVSYLEESPVILRGQGARIAGDRDAVSAS